MVGSSQAACALTLLAAARPVARVPLPWPVRRGLVKVARHGISHDDPGITAPDQRRYDAFRALPARRPLRTGQWRL